MGIITSLFGKKEEPQPRVIAFVDYEHWYYSYQKLFGLKPDPVEWRQELEKKYRLDDVMVFADFGYKGINDELTKLRAMTNTIIETQQTFSRSKKDMTDFIMLDYIYQTAALRPEITTYILFTGDGHFQSVVKYLVQRLGKQVIVYGVKDAFSNQLKAVASECLECPATDDVLKSYYKMIVENLAYVTERQSIIPTFLGTVAAVAKRNDVPENLVHAALQEMMDRGLVYQTEQKVSFNRKVKVVAANWPALEKVGLWTYA